MTLDDYLTKNAVTETQLAEAVGVTQPHIWRIRHRHARPSRDVAIRIEAATGIPAAELVMMGVIPVEERQQIRRRA